MTHSDWELQRERLSAYLDGELPASERAALDAHLPGCEECQRELAALRQTRALLRALPTPALPRAFTLPEQPIAVAERRRRALAWTRPAQALGGLAAMIGLGILVGTTVPQIATSHSMASGAATSASQARTAEPATTGTPGTPNSNFTESKPNTPQVGGSGTVYSPEHQPAANGHVTTVEPFPVAPVAGGTLLVGGVAAVAAGSLARRRGSR